VKRVADGRGSSTANIKQGSKSRGQQRGLHLEAELRVSKRIEDGCQPSELSSGALALLYAPEILFIAAIAGYELRCLCSSSGAHDKHALTESRAAM